MLSKRVTHRNPVLFLVSSSECPTYPARRNILGLTLLADLEQDWKHKIYRYVVSRSLLFICCVQILSLALVFRHIDFMFFPRYKRPWVSINQDNGEERFVYESWLENWRNNYLWSEYKCLLNLFLLVVSVFALAFKSRTSGLWCDTCVSENHAASIFRVMTFARLWLCHQYQLAERHLCTLLLILKRNWS